VWEKLEQILAFVVFGPRRISLCAMWLPAGDRLPHSNPPPANAVFGHPAYSPDLTPSNIFLCTDGRQCLKPTPFNHEKLCAAMNVSRNAVPQKTLGGVFEH
jgi:hypothetical protein